MTLHHLINTLEGLAQEERTSDTKIQRAFLNLCEARNSLKSALAAYKRADEASNLPLCHVTIQTKYRFARDDWTPGQIKSVVEDMIFDHAAETEGIGEVTEVEVTKIVFPDAGVRQEGWEYTSGDLHATPIASRKALDA